MGVFIYLNSKSNLGNAVEKSFKIEVNCRGMVCRCEDGLLQHETISKGKKFQASWRRYTRTFFRETKSRLLLCVVQSGIDTELGKINYSSIKHSETKTTFDKCSLCKDNYDQLGIFNGTQNYFQIQHATLEQNSLLQNTDFSSNDADLQMAIINSINYTQSDEKKNHSTIHNSSTSSSDYQIVDLFSLEEKKISTSTKEKQMQKKTI